MSEIDLQRIEYLMLNAACNLALTGMPQKLAVQAMEAVSVYISDPDTPLKKFDGTMQTGTQAMDEAEKAIDAWESHGLIGGSKPEADNER